MNKRLKYSGTDKMSDLICENYNLLLVMSRFGLSLGFGDQTVQQVCERQGVHTGTFLAVVLDVRIGHIAECKINCPVASCNRHRCHCTPLCKLPHLVVVTAC